MFVSVIFFNDTATIEIYTLSLHDALPIWAVRHLQVHRLEAVPRHRRAGRRLPGPAARGRGALPVAGREDRKGTRLNSSHANISYAVFLFIKRIPEELK